MSSPENSPLLVFGAHPDDIEFGCGAIIAAETGRGRSVHFVVCSLGEAGTNGTPEQREHESRQAAEILGASIEFIQLDGDAHLELKTEHTFKLAEIIRRIRPSTVLATTCEENQHPDHSRLGKLVRDAARVARYGGLHEIAGLEVHSIQQLFYYAVTSEGEPRELTPMLFDISSPDVFSKWTSAMSAHGTQAATRDYIDLQHTRARLLGARAGVAYAMALFSNDPMLFDSLAGAGKGARNF